MLGRELIKEFVPPILIGALRDSRIFGKPGFIWEGIYTHRREVPTENNSYDDDIEVKKHYDWTRTALDLVYAGKPPHLCHEALALLAAIAGGQTNTVSVLDVGGAVGA